MFCVWLWWKNRLSHIEQINHKIRFQYLNVDLLPVLSQNIENWNRCRFEIVTFSPDFIVVCVEFSILIHGNWDYSRSLHIGNMPFRWGMSVRDSILMWNHNKQKSQFREKTRTEICFVFYTTILALVSIIFVRFDNWHYHYDQNYVRINLEEKGELLSTIKCVGQE